MPNAVFEPVDHTSVAESIVVQIETLILNGILRDGGRLPSERDLADQMGVSRPKLREALKQLEDNKSKLKVKYLDYDWSLNGK